MVLEIITVFGKLTKIIDVHDFIFIEKLVSRNIPLLNVYFGSFLMLRWVVNRVICYKDRLCICLIIFNV